MRQALHSTWLTVVLVAFAGAGGCETEATHPVEPLATKPLISALDPGGESAQATPHSTPHFVVSKKVATTVSGKGDGPYRFTAPWHTKVEGNWAKVLKDYAGKPNLSYLEIGVFEGRSMLWMLENILTDDTSKITVIDVFMGDYEQTFDANVTASGAADRISKITGPSRRELRAMSGVAFDFIYIDGSHTADDVLADAVMSWDLLKLGGLLIFDDYGWKGRPEGGALPMELRPQVAIDLFLTAHRRELELVHRDYQVIVRKVDNPCKPKDYCTPLGDYQYYWRAFELRDAGGKRLKLSREETNLLERIALSYQVGALRYNIPKQVRESAEFKALMARLSHEL